jgi:hypothetical protein
MWRYQSTAVIAGMPSFFPMAPPLGKNPGRVGAATKKRWRLAKAAKAQVAAKKAAAARKKAV